MNLKNLKKIYDRLGNDRIRAGILRTAELLSLPVKVLRMDTNDVCNIECVMCGNKPERCTEDRRMSIEDFDRLIDKLGKTIRLLYLSCSYEPLMTPNFCRYLQSSKSRGIPFVSFCTNALLLSEEISLCAVDLGIDEIIISFNGYTPDDYNRIMFRSHYDVVMRNLKNLVDYKGKKKRALPRIRINTILMKTNLVNFGHLTSFIDQFDVDSVQFREFKVDEAHNNNPVEIEREALSNLSETERRNLLSHVRDEIRTLSKRGKTVMLPSNLMKSGGDITEKQVEKRGSCAVPFFSLWADYRGDLRICCGDSDGSMVGNIFKDDPDTITARRDNFRKLALSGKCRMGCKMNLNSSTMI